jgi:hypothetical protein
VRCAHRPGVCAPRRAAERAPTGHRLPRRSVAVRVEHYLRHASRPAASHRRSGPREARHPRQKLVAPGLWGPGAARLWGGEEHRACGQREARSSTLSLRLSERSGRRARSELRNGPQDRAPQRSRRVQRTTAPPKHRTRPPQAWGDATEEDRPGGWPARQEATGSPAARPLRARACQPVHRRPGPGCWRR